MKISPGTRGRIPGGRLREPPDTLLAADAILAIDDRRSRSARSRGTRPSSCSGRLADRGSRRRGGRAAASAGSVLAHCRHRPARSASSTTCAHPAARSSARSLFPDHHPLFARATSSGSFERRAPQARPAWPRPRRTSCVCCRSGRFRCRSLRVPLTMEPDPLPEFRSWLRGALRRRAGSLTPSD